MRRSQSEIRELSSSGTRSVPAGLTMVTCDRVHEMDQIKWMLFLSLSVA